MAARSKIRVAVIGGGLGGTPAAIMLQQAGYSVKVYEQASSLARIGAGINLSPNATSIVCKIGLQEPLLREGLIASQFVQRDWDTGRMTFDLRYDQFTERYGWPHIIMHRGDLQTILNSGLEPGTLELGKRLTDLEDDGRCIRLIFEDGSEAEADLAIGADGINSKVREILLGVEKPTYTGAIAHRSIFPSSLLGGMKFPDATKWWGDDRYFMCYYLTPARDEIYVVTGVPSQWDSEDFSPAPTVMSEMRQAFDGFHSDVQRIIAACPESLSWPVLYRDPYPLWSRGRMVLLGDACHPMKPHMGQGAAMAMEDAAVLVRCLEHFNGDDLTAAFRLYEELRYERTARVKLESQRAGDFGVRFSAAIIVSASVIF